MAIKTPETKVGYTTPVLQLKSKEFYDAHNSLKFQVQI